MINHSNITSGSLYFDVNTRSSNFLITKKISVNEELFINYGNRTNREFLLHNGFIPDFINKDDNYELRLGFLIFNK